MNGFSVDLEDWYQAVTSLNARPDAWDIFERRVSANTDRLLALLGEYRVRATFFVLGIVAEQHPGLIRRIDQAGHEIGVHGYAHRNIRRLRPAEFASELDKALAVIAPLVTQPLHGHRAPYFSINAQNLWALEVLESKGFRYDSSFFATRNTLYGYPDAPRFPHRLADCRLVELPLATWRWAGINWPVAGGFYLRLFPYVYTRMGLQALNRAGQPAVLYMHPWELDAGHRYSRVKPREYIVQYTGRAGLEAKLRRLFSEFHFGPLCELAAAVG